MGSCSTTSSVPKSFRYDVFLSFAGEDTRYEFIGHLYRALTSNKIETYKDDEKIKKGERISDQLLKAIEDSRFHIIVFSKSYAASSWCLDELVKIMECQNTAEQTAYPLFFDVEPTEVRKQSGAVGVAFAKHENKEAANKWKDSLEKAAAIGGWELKKINNGDESKLIQIIVEEIQQKLHSINFQVDGELVGMETRIKDFVSSLETDFDDVRMIGIKGMGGGGKTTLARAVFDRISINFDGQSFVENVREVSDSVLGLKSLQNQILSDVFNDPKLTVSSVSGGKNMMIRMMRRRKVLLVLDDVSDIKQLQALAGVPNWFKEGSRIIITTRDKQVLVAHGVNSIRDVNLLTHGEAICLFSKNAFGGDIPIPEFQELSEKVVHYAAGLPLTIKVLGSLLRGAELLDWISALERLKTIPLDDTLQTLKLSYDVLEEDYKEIFLDVACILKGWEKEKAVEVLESCGFHARYGLRVLEQKSLLTVSQYGTLGIHDHIEEMGKYIVRQSYRSEPNRHSRLWILKEIVYILANNLDTDAIQCIKFEWCSDNHPVTFMKRLGNMKKLRVLHLEWFQYFPDGYLSWDGLMKSLRYLCWNGYPFESLTKSFQADNLVGLTLSNSRIKQFWNSGERKVLHNLRFLDMSSSDLRTFDLEMTPNIETLNLGKCHHLVELNMPVACLKLRSLNAGSSPLRTFDLRLTPNLEFLDLERCRYLEELNMPFGCSKQFKALYLGYSALRTLKLAPTPDLHALNLAGCKDLAELTMPYQCPKLKFLTANSSKLKTLNLAPTPDLETLDLGGCKDLAELTMPYQCPKLKFLRANSSKLKTLDLQPISNLETLYLEDCHDLVELHIPKECPNLKYLSLQNSVLRNLNLGSTTDRLEGCHDLLEFRLPFQFPKLKSFSLKCSKFRTLDLRLTSDLETVSLEECRDLVELHMPNECPKLKYLSLKNSALKNLNLGSTPNIEELRLEGCHDLLELHVPSRCPKLKDLILECSKLRTLNLGLSSDLEMLILQECGDLVELHMPKECTNLKTLSLFENSNLRKINLGQTPDLKELRLEGCHDLLEFRLPFRCPKLKSLSLRCSKLKILDFGQTSNLVFLSLEDCYELVKLHMPNECPKLKYLGIKNSAVGNLNIGLTPDLETLSLEECHDLVDLQMPFGCPKLNVLISYCSKLRTLDFGLTLDLETLSLHRCCNLVELCIPNECPNLKSFSLKYSPLRYLNLASTPNLDELDLSGCHDLVELHMPSRYPKLKSLYLHCSKLRTLYLGLILDVETLSLEECHDLVELHMPKECPNLKTLSLFENSNLRKINLGQTPNFEVLNLEGCHDLLEFRLPFRCPKLKFLSLKCPKLRILDFGQTSDLETLSLEECRELVELHMQCPKLKYLNLKNSVVRNLNLGLTPDLETLSLEGCHDLVELRMPFQCPKLKVLSLECSKLRTLKLAPTPNLETLSLGGGCFNLVELHMLNECPKLQSLSLNNLQLRSLDLGLTPNLERLNIKECFNLVELRAPIGCLGKLVYIDLSDCGGFKRFSFYRQIRSPVGSLHLIAKSIDTCPLHSDSNLPKFQFSCLYGEPISSSIGNLISIGLCPCTNLDSFSRSICDLRGLRKLTLEGSIPEVPKDLERLQSLEELSLLSTTIKHLPDSICMLKHLKLLEFNSCLLIEKLPEGLGRLECLEDLNITSCIRLQDIPKSICELKRLKCFNLSSCLQVKNLPRDLGRLECLKELNIKDTGISDLPDAIFELEGLHIVASDGLSFTV